MKTETQMVQIGDVHECPPGKLTVGINIGWNVASPVRLQPGEKIDSCRCMSTEAVAKMFRADIARYAAALRVIRDYVAKAQPAPGDYRFQLWNHLHNAAHCCEAASCDPASANLNL